VGALPSRNWSAVHAVDSGALGELAQANIAAEAGKTVDLNLLRYE
jgi:hypothetical protein